MKSGWQKSKWTQNNRSSRVPPVGEQQYPFPQADFCRAIKFKAACPQKSSKGAIEAQCCSCIHLALARAAVLPLGKYAMNSPVAGTLEMTPPRGRTITSAGRCWLARVELDLWQSQGETRSRTGTYHL
jgi:hypothetical protein